MDRAKAVEIRKKLEEVLALFDEKGLKVTLGKCTFDSHAASFKLEVASVSEDGLVLGRAATAYEQLAVIYGLPKDGLGKTFKAGADEYKIIGLNPRSGKYPVKVVRVADGSERKANLAWVKRAMGLPVAPHDEF